MTSAEKRLPPLPTKEFYNQNSLRGVSECECVCVDARIAPPFMPRQPMRVDWCVSSGGVVKNKYSLTHTRTARGEDEAEPGEGWEGGARPEEYVGLFDGP